MEINIRKNNLESITILDLNGELDLYTAKKLKKIVLNLINEDSKKFILYMKDNTYPDSTGVGTIIKLIQEIKNRNGSLKII